MEQNAKIAVVTILLSFLSCKVYSLNLTPSGSILFCEGETVDFLCGEESMTVHWRIGNDKYNDSNSMRVGPLNGTNNGTSVQCSTNEHESPTTLLLFDTPPQCALDVHSTFVPFNRSLFVWWNIGQCKSTSLTAFEMEWTSPTGYGTTGSISSAMYVIPNIEPLKEYTITVSLINKCGKGTISEPITFGSPIFVSILLGLVLVVFLALAMVISVTPACYRNIKANMKGKAVEYERLRSAADIELKVTGVDSGNENIGDSRLQSIADEDTETSTNL